MLYGRSSAEAHGNFLQFWTKRRYRPFFAGVLKCVLGSFPITCFIIGKKQIQLYKKVQKVILNTF